MIVVIDVIVVMVVIVIFTVTINDNIIIRNCFLMLSRLKIDII